MILAPVASLRAVAPRIVQRALQYIEATASTPIAAPAVLAPAPPGRSITIEKLGATPNQVGGVILLGPPKRAYRVVEDLSRLLGSRVAQKRVLLSRVRLPTILLLVDSYIYGEREHWQAAVSRVALTGFHTVARIADVGVCQVLHSDERAWHGAA